LPHFKGIQSFIPGEQMKVDPNVQSIVNDQSDAVQNGKTTRMQGTASEASTAQADGTDSVRFSSDLAEMQRLTAKLQALPDVRADRVSSLKQQIERGTYKPDPTGVAGAILKDPLNRSGNQ
jgi:negative regulator of flagellin synthesis FlgM